MKELSLHILDIAQNSISAGASYIKIELTDSENKDLLGFSVRDDGCGMTEDFLQKVIDPFTTSRTTRNVGMGIPLLRSAALMTGGDFHISSKPGFGTEISADFIKSNIDCPPLGDIDSTIIFLVMGSPGINFNVKYETDKGQFIMDTGDFKKELGDIPLETPEILNWIREWFKENREAVY